MKIILFVMCLLLSAPMDALSIGGGAAGGAMVTHLARSKSDSTKGQTKKTKPSLGENKLEYNPIVISVFIVVLILLFALLFYLLVRWWRFIS